MKRNKHIRCLRSALSTFPVPRTEPILYAFRFNFICSPFTPSPKFPLSLALIGTELLHSQYRRFPARGQALALCTSQESLLPPDQPTEGNLSLMPETALKKKKKDYQSVSYKFSRGHWEEKAMAAYLVYICACALMLAAPTAPFAMIWPSSCIWTQRPEDREVWIHTSEPVSAWYAQNSVLA